MSGAAVIRHATCALNALLCACPIGAGFGKVWALSACGRRVLRRARTNTERDTLFRVDDGADFMPFLQPAIGDRVDGVAPERRDVESDRLSACIREMRLHGFVEPPRLIEVDDEVLEQLGDRLSEPGAGDRRGGS